MLDSTPLYDAVATMDTVTLIRSAVRGLLNAAEAGLRAQLWAALRSVDDYAGLGKPHDHAVVNVVGSGDALHRLACITACNGF